jgi:large subunit ribosomal protein L13
MKTYVPKEGDLSQGWWIVDAEGMTLGRVATEVARRIQGKHKPRYAPFLPCGDHVVVVNAAKVVLTGNKWDQKLYRRHSGQPGGLKEMTAAELRAKHPERLVEYAVWGMLPKGPLGRRLARRLKVYPGPDHPHQAQRPTPLPLPGARRAS